MKEGYYRYYSTQRPFGPGTFPKQGGTECIVNFDEKIFCEEIGKEAWGYVAYKEPISDKDIKEYELTKGGNESVVLIGQDGSGKTVAFIK